MQQRPNLQLRLGCFLILRIVFWNTQIREVVIPIPVSRSIKKRERLVVIRMADWIVGMRMALHAIHGYAVEYRPRCSHAIHDFN